MKFLKTTIAVLFLVTILISCSKESKTPDNNNTVAVPLVKQMVLTLPYITGVKDNTYDGKNRLATVGGPNDVITYRAGGFEIVSTYDNGDKLITDVNLDNGRISTVLSYPSEIERYNSSFSYDSKGRLIKIHQTGTFNGNVINTWDYTYTWDDNDNLIATDIQDNQGGSDKETYSGFSAENVNTLSGKNFGFDYFGTTSFTGSYTPNHDGGPGGVFPWVYGGKLLPSVISTSSGVTNITYHKNAQGYIDKIENVIPNNANASSVIDIAYQ